MNMTMVPDICIYISFYYPSAPGRLTEIQLKIPPQLDFWSSDFQLVHFVKSILLACEKLKPLLEPQSIPYRDLMTMTTLRFGI
jgi:hypothetical protein